MNRDRSMWLFQIIQSQSGKRYLFDGLDNEIYELNDDIIIHPHTSREELELPIFNRNIHIDELTQHKIQHSAKTLILELTEQCNLRCSYCVFDETYSNERSHSMSKMDLSLAKKSIDAFYKRAKDDAYIVFYGGEPLLAFDEIINLTEYAKKLFKGRIKFSFTTNGMALTKDKLNFLIENDFLITVSLDGHKVNHDKYRITVNGKPTWDRILKNLNEIFQINKDYFDNNIQINSVINNLDELDLIEHEISNIPYLSTKNIRYSFVLQNSIEMNKEYNLYIEKNYEKIKEIFLHNQFAENTFLKDRLLNLVKKLAFRTIGYEAQNGKKKCIPFEDRTYIRTNGEQQFCERIANYARNKSENDLLDLSINIQRDFYEKKKYGCENCIAYNFCEMCPASFLSEGSFSDKMDAICNNFRNEFLLALKLYIDLSEENIIFANLS